MGVQPNDLLLIERAGTAYKAQASDLVKVEGFATRAALVTHIATNGALAGQSYFAEGLGWRAIPAGHVLFGTNPIPDLPGLMPIGNATPEHMGVVDGVDDHVQIKAAWDFMGSIGGGDVPMLPKPYYVSLDGVYETGSEAPANGDRNACLKLNATNTVMLRGVRGKTIIQQVGTEIAHCVRFGSYSENIVGRGGLTGIIVKGNRTTAVSVGTRFEGGHGIAVAAPADGQVSTVVLDDFEVHDTWNYGVGFQRGQWKGCRITNFVILRAGNDGIDWKYDTNALGESNNIIAHGLVKDHSMRGTAHTGAAKAGVDARDGVSVYDVEIECANPGAVGFRQLTGDDGVPGADPDVPNRSQADNIRIKMAPGTVTNAEGTVLQSMGFMKTTSRSQASNIYSEGANYNFWISGEAGKLVNITGRNAGVTNLYVNATSGSDYDNNQFIGVEMIGGGTRDIHVVGTGEPVGTQIIGMKAGVVQIDAGAVDTLLVGKVTTLTDNGTNTRLLTMQPTPQRFGRQADQHILLTGDGAANLIQGVSGASAKHTRLEADSNSLDVQLNAEASGRVVSFRTQNVERAQVNTGGLQIPSSMALLQNGRIQRLGGTGSPEGVVTAPVGSIYTRGDGGAGTTLYVKESGSGNTGWVAK